MTIFARNKVHCKSLSTSLICKLAQNKVISDDSVVNFGLCRTTSELQSSDSDNEIGYNQETDCKCGTSGCEQYAGQVVPVVMVGMV
jgi:hypothetical protein